MKTIILLICLGFFASDVLGQNSFQLGFKENPEISDIKGNPLNNESIYLPIIKAPFLKHYINNNGELKFIKNEHLDLFADEFGKERIKDTLLYHKIDPIHQAIYSKYLSVFDEQILHNYYLGRDIIRLTYLPANGYLFVIKMEAYAESTTLTLKVLDYQIDYTLVERAFNGDFTSISNSKNDADWIINTKSKLDKYAFNKLKMLITSLNFMTEVPFYNDENGLDGFDMIIEIHSASGYYYNKRWSPSVNSSIRKIADYMIELSEQKINLD